MSNEAWIKSSEREAFEKLIQFMIQCVSSEYYDEFRKLLATYRKRAFDAGVFEAEKKLKEK
jgi:hypothetical protein